jgi:hypothetical protein
MTKARFVAFTLLAALWAGAILLGTALGNCASASADGEWQPPAESELLTVFEQALAQWGVSGMHVDVQYEHLQLASAVSTPSYDLKWCKSRIDPRTMTERTILHEAGHCAGYHRPGELPISTFAGHSTDPASVMYPWREPGQVITADDRAVVRASRLFYIPPTYTITLGGLAR